MADQIWYITTSLENGRAGEGVRTYGERDGRKMRVITNLWKGRTVYVCVTASEPESSDCLWPFLCTAKPVGIAIELEDSKGKNPQLPYTGVCCRLACFA